VRAHARARAVVNDFWGLSNQQDKTQNIFVLAHKISEGSLELEEARTHEVHWSQAVESTNDNLEQQTVINEPQAEDFEAVVERPQLITTALKKRLQMMDNSIISLRMKV
jgi:hypothetical protein